MGVAVIMWALSYSPDGNIEKSLIYPVGKFIEPVGIFLVWNGDYLLLLLFPPWAKKRH